MSQKKSQGTASAYQFNFIFYAEGPDVETWYSITIDKFPKQLPPNTEYRMYENELQQLSSNFVKSDSGTETHPEASGLASSGTLGHFRRIFSEGIYSKKVKRSANWNSRISSPSSISSNCSRHMGLKIGWNEDSKQSARGLPVLNLGLAMGCTFCTHRHSAPSHTSAKS